MMDLENIVLNEFRHRNTDIGLFQQWLTLFLQAPKSLQMVIAAIKVKDAYSLEGKL